MKKRRKRAVYVASAVLTVDFESVCESITDLFECYKEKARQFGLI